MIVLKLFGDFFWTWRYTWQANKEMAEVQARLDQKKIDYREHMARCDQRKEVNKERGGMTAWACMTMLVHKHINT